MSRIKATTQEATTTGDFVSGINDGMSAAEQCLQLKCGGFCSNESTYIYNSLLNQSIDTKLSLLTELASDGIITKEEKEKAFKRLEALHLPTQYSCCSDKPNQDQEHCEYIQLKNLIKECDPYHYNSYNDDIICTCIDSEGNRAGGDNCRLCFNASYTWILEVFGAVTGWLEGTCKTASDVDSDINLKRKPVEAINCQEEDSIIPVRRPRKQGSGKRFVAVCQDSEEQKEEMALNYIADATSRTGAAPVKRSSFFAATKRLSQSFYG